MAVVICLLALVPLLFRVPNPLERPILYEIHDGCHAILFLVLTLFMLAFARKVAELRKIELHPVAQIMLVSLICLGLGVAIEVAQKLVGRSASWGDVFRDSLGVISAVLIYLAFGLKTPKLIASVLTLFSLAPLAWAFAPAYPYIEAERIRNIHFPILMDFEIEQSGIYLENFDGANLSIVSPPEKWKDNNSGSVGHLVLPKGNRWPGFELRSPYPNWSYQQVFTMEVYSPMDVSFQFVLVCYHADNSRKPLVHQTFIVKPGLNRLTYNLTGKEDKISKIILHTLEREKDLQLYVDNIRLK